MRLFLCAILAAGQFLNENVQQFLEVIREKETVLPVADVSQEGKYFGQSDVCWDCMYPIKLAGWGPKDEFVNYSKKKFCSCGPFHKGVRLSFWEPMMIVEVTPTPFKLVSLGGVQVWGQNSYTNWGGVMNTDSGRTSFYNVHYIQAPLMHLAGLFPGFECLTKWGDILAPLPVWMSEFDPSWRRPGLARIFSLSMYKYNTPYWQKQCIEDGKASNDRKPNNDYHWCAGCNGSLYPLVGHVSTHIGGVQSSSLLVHRWLVRHQFLRSLMKVGTGFKPENFCNQTIFDHLQKTHYKIQMLHPKPEANGENRDGKRVFCHPLGETTEYWGSERTYPQGGEDFSYLVWTKMQCCYNAFALLKKIPIVGQIIEVIEEVVGDEEE